MNFNFIVAVFMLIETLSMMGQEQRFLSVNTHGVSIDIANFCASPDSLWMQRIKIHNSSTQGVWFCLDCISSSYYLPDLEPLFGIIVNTRIGAGSIPGGVLPLYLPVTLIKPGMDTTIFISVQSDCAAIKSTQIILDVDFVVDSDDVKPAISNYLLRDRVETGMDYHRYAEEAIKIRISSLP